jgi:NADPH:quinone reductase-like Zn-dependent oxidoreductase
MVRSFGATAVFDYTSPSVGSDIRAYTDGRLRYALDCITDQASAECCYNAMGRTGCSYTSLEVCLAERRPRDGVKYDFFLALEGFGKDLKLGGEYTRSGSTEKKALAIVLFRMMQKLLDESIMKTHPTEVIGEGFDKVLEGLEVLEKGEVKGKKLVVMI